METLILTDTRYFLGRVGEDAWDRWFARADELFDEVVIPSMDADAKSRLYVAAGHAWSHVQQAKNRLFREKDQKERQKLRAKYLHQEDVAEMLLNLTAGKGKPAKTFNDRATDMNMTEIMLRRAGVTKREATT